jgi:hypothetical protein
VNRSEKCVTTRSFGIIRSLLSGRYQASYVGPDDTRHNAPVTLKQRSIAREFLRTQEALNQLNPWEQDSDFELQNQKIPLLWDYCERHIPIQKPLAVSFWSCINRTSTELSLLTAHESRHYGRPVRRGASCRE